ncbi:MAG: galU [Alphaproteobacteria bacterium]|nr:galU [Alphaproteobacteria bacterium]
MLLPDDLMVGRPGCLAQMVAAYEQVGGNVVCVEEVAPDRTASYGIISPGARDGRLTEVKGLVEKPRPEDAPSNLGIVGRYILQPEVMRVLDDPVTGAGGEIQLTDAMAVLIGRQPFHGVTVDAERHDCGDKIGFVKANLALALRRDDVGPALRAFLSEQK